MTAVFLDRDGVINVNRSDHVKCWSEFQFLPTALAAISRLARIQVKVFVITNQAIVNRGIVSRETVDDINRMMSAEIVRHGGRVDAVAYCPHRPDEGCDCRKPRPGLILDLARRNGLCPQDAVVIGDALSDVVAAREAGSRPIMVLTGRGQEQLALAGASGQADFVVATDLSAAVDVVVGLVDLAPAVA